MVWTALRLGRRCCDGLRFCPPPPTEVYHIGELDMAPICQCHMPPCHPATLHPSNQTMQPAPVSEFKVLELCQASQLARCPRPNIWETIVAPRA